jgi:para-nitrobenzyl esterase
VGVGNPSIGPDPAKYGPVVDGWVLADSPLDAIRAGAHNRLPFAIGTDGEELAVMLTVKVTTEAEFLAIVKASLAALGQAAVDQVLAAYPVADYPSPQDALVALYSDMRFNCPARAIARAAAGNVGEQVWRYFFTRRVETKQGPKPAQHGIELLFVFGTADDIPLYQPAPADQALSEAIMGYWTRFGATGDPNGDGAVAWPAYDAAKDTYLRLDAPNTGGEGVRTPQCDLFDSIVGWAL